MTKLKKRAARGAAKATAKHAVHGAVGKTKRSPLRTTALLAIGAVVGVAIAQIANRAGNSGPESRTPGAWKPASATQTPQTPA